MQEMIAEETPSSLVGERHAAAQRRSLSLRERVRVRASRRA